MADKIQFRRDTAARWAEVNPILLSGEIGLVTDSVNKYKLGDGVHTWNELPLQGFNGNIVDIPGTDSSSAMSQKGATDLTSEYNVSANNSNAEYTFAQAVALVPASLQKGGLTIKYIDSTTHEYAIKRLMSSTWNTTESNWQSENADEQPIAFSSNLVLSGGVKNANNNIKYGTNIPFSLRNGSQGNAGNSWVVTIKGQDGSNIPIPVTAGAKYRITINKQPEMGYDFFMRIVTYSTTTPTNLESQTVRNEVNNWTKYYKSGDEIQINEGEVALSIQLTELTYAGAAQTSDTCIALRNSDFANGDIEIRDVSVLSLYSLDKKIDKSNADITTILENLNNELKGDITEIYSSVGASNTIKSDNDIRNGSPGNNGNSYCVATKNRIDAEGFNFVCLFTNRPNSENCVYRWVYRTYSTTEGASSSDTGLIRDVYDYSTKDNPFVFAITNTEKAIAFGVTEYNTLTKENTALRTTDFDGYYLGVAKYSKGLINELLKRISELEIEIEKIESTPDASRRYLDKTGTLCNASRFHAESASSKDLQFVILTDVHGDTIVMQNSAKVAKAFNTVDALMCLGDIVTARYNDSFKESFASIMVSINKPFYVCLGNHDVGNAKYIGFCATHQQAYNSFIKPIVDAGYLSSGEYDAGLSYYYHDFATQKIRLIVLNEYDEPLDIDNTYWHEITYDSSLENVAVSTSYSAGNKVNVPGYTDYSFECINAITTPSSFYVSEEEQIKFPSYKIMRGYRVIRQTQAQWLLDTLASTPANYGVVIATHQAWSENAQNQQEYKFAQDVSFQSTSLLQNYMATDFIANAVNAFVNGNNYSENVAMKGAAAYLNTQGENTYAYSVSKDFSLKNTGVKFLCFIGGHTHRDLIFKHTVYPQYQICPICATTDYANNIGNDIKREDTRVFGDGYGVDSLTSISFDYNGLLRLVKIGVETTTAMTLRDQELLNLNE